jgi:hypothetical protein
MNVNGRLKKLERAAGDLAEAEGGEEQPWLDELERIDRYLVERGVCLRPLIDFIAEQMVELDKDAAAEGAGIDQLDCFLIEMLAEARPELVAEELGLEHYSIPRIVVTYARRRRDAEDSGRERAELWKLANTAAYSPAEAEQRAREEPRHARDVMWGWGPYTTLVWVGGVPCCHFHGGLTPNESSRECDKVLGRGQPKKAAGL